MRVVVDICSPNARRLAGAGTTWVVFGDGAGDLEQLTMDGDPAAIADRYISGHRNCCLVFVTEHNGRPVRLGLRRGLLTQRKLFYRRVGGEVTVDDVLRNAIGRVPTAERTPNTEAVIEHYLYRRPQPPLTYIPSVTALPTATAVDVDLAGGSETTRLVDRLDVAPVRRPFEEYLADVGEALAEAVTASLRPETTAVMFSGGIDSTLLLTYCRDTVTPMTIVPDSPEFARETGYATDAAALLGVSTVPVPVREDDYADLLRDVIVRLGYPAIHDMMPFNPALLHAAPRHVMMGQLSDSLFGLDSRALRAALRRSGAPARAAARLAARILTGDLGRRAGRLSSRAAALAADPLSLDGMGTNAFLTGDRAEVSRIAGDGIVDDVLARLTSAIFARATLQATNRRDANLEAGHLAIIVTGPGGHEDLLAEEHGREALSPFEHEDVIEAALRIPADERFVRDGVVKWVPKLLLQRRLPGYPVFQEKLHTKLPVDRYYRSGSLAGVWDRYDLPDFLDEPARRRVRSGFDMMTWNAISHAMWLEHVGRQPDLPRYPVTVSVSSGAPQETASTS